METVHNPVLIVLGYIAGNLAAALIKADCHTQRHLQIGLDHIGDPGQGGKLFKLRLHLEIHGEIQDSTVGFRSGGDIIELQAAGGEGDILTRALLLHAAAHPLPSGKLHIHLGNALCRLLIFHLIGGVFCPLVGGVQHAADAKRKQHQGNQQRYNCHDQTDLENTLHHS